ncbi:MAG: pilus assembly protein [Devosia sp.]|jgi:Flp pilus assembly protein TadG|nr:pilus assembly protein [Devosia sp.]
MIRRLKQFRDDIRAVAAVEFALILPLLITLYLGTIEAATLYSADHKVATVASTMADLVSREKGEISSATLDKYFEAAETIMRPYTTSGLVQVVSLLSINSDGVATVKWSQAHGTAEAREADSEYPLDADTKINELARGSSGWLVASEITYPHEPIFGLIIPNTITLKHTEYFLPRFKGEIELD